MHDTDTPEGIPEAEVSIVRPGQTAMVKGVHRSVERRKLEKRLVRLTAQAITDFGMIRDGDKVMVCMSGGKDSWCLLDILMRLQQRAPIHFDLLAVNLNGHIPGFPDRLIPEQLEKMGVPYYIEDQDIWSTVRKHIKEGEPACSLCSRLRRGVLYNVAERFGITKIALGHHMDDVVSTLLLNMFFSGHVKSMPPILKSDDSRNTVIRPMVYLREKELVRWTRMQEFPLVSKEMCRPHENKQRALIKQMMAEWDREYPGRVERIFGSLSRVVPSHLYDRTLFDFDSAQWRLKGGKASTESGDSLDLKEYVDAAGVPANKEENV